MRTRSPPPARRSTCGSCFAGATSSLLRGRKSRADLLGDLDLLAATSRMTEARRALPVITDVVDDRIVMFRADAGGHAIETELLAHAPGDVLVGAWRVARHAEGADDAARIVESEAAAEDDDAAEMLTDERVALRPVSRGISGIERGGVGRVAKRGTEEIPARLRGGIEIAGREREFRGAHAVRGVRLLRGDGAARRPLVVDGVAAEGDRADCAIARDDRGPFVIVEPA